MSDQFGIVTDGFLLAAIDLGLLGLRPIPVNTALPTISGVAQVAQTATVVPGTWTNSPTSRAYQWQREGVNIPGGTGTTHIYVAADLGCLTQVVEIATK